MALLHITEAVVVTPDVAGSARFCQEALGFEVLERSPRGAGLGAPSAARSVLLAAAGSPSGRLRLVQGDPPTPLPLDSKDLPALWDLGPRLFGLYSRSLQATVAAVEAAGGTAGPIVAYPYGAGEMREIVARGPEGIWWTIPEAPGSRQPSPALDADPSRLHSELHSTVLVVEDHDAALRFFAEGGGMTVLFDGPMAGELFERLVGMPPGAALRLSFLVGRGRGPARLEIMSFTGVSGADRRASPWGIRRLVVAADDPPATAAALQAAGARPGPAPGVLVGPAEVEICLVGPPGGQGSSS